MNYLKIYKCRTGKSFTHIHKNTQEKLRKTSATVWFNEFCSSKPSNSQYSKITVRGHNKQCHNTLRQP